MELRPRIVIVGGDEAARREVAAVLERGGFSIVTSRSDVPAGAPIATDDVPDLLVVVGDMAPCRRARSTPVLEDVPILAVPAPGASAEALAAGADDVAEGPLEVPVVATRARRLIASAHTRSRAHLVEYLQDAMLRIHSLSASDGDNPHVLRQALLVTLEAMEFDRASLIAHLDGSDTAYVLAATDDPSLSQFAIAIASYPELRAAIEQGKPVLIDDAETDPVTASVAATLVDKGVRAVAVFPVIWKGRSLGAVLLRRSRPGVGHLNNHRLAFGLMFAKHAAARLHHGKVLESLRDQTHRISRARYEAERRLRTIDSLKEHFEAAADGVIVLEREGRIVFVNRTAERITGFARDGLVNADIGALVTGSQRELVDEAVAQVLHGQNVEAFDLDLSTTSEELICVSVSTSTVLSQSGAAILSFRDVTAQRVLEGELRKTKEFLERLIDSTVDAIVSADLRGNIIIFNQGAERIFGYAADEVIGRIPVWDLYAADVPQRVMRMLRSTQYGGVGRIEQTRREVVNKNGERVPVNMTASIVYEEGREVATVGIFSDLRDRIRIEQRLLQAQEKLEMTKEQAVLGELAGAAAHELNQPLQSIVGYAELIQRQSEPDAPHGRAVDIIMREAERMAMIVRKIGKITKYETKEYVPGTRVLDLEKSSHSGGEGASLVFPRSDVAFDGVVEDEFEDEHQITIAQVELDEVLPAADAAAGPSAPAGDDAAEDDQDLAGRPR